MTREEILLKLQVALLGEVFPSLRGVGYSIRDGSVVMHFYHDGPIAENDRESIAMIETEFIALVDRPTDVSSSINRIDVPQRLPDPEEWVYRRRE
jgi:hypothetical protein